ncbi:MAG: DUF2341 domain-containing protein [Thermoplasmata archaeon]|nr:MAG: DUF2341 domain-containing protein [Thermoplasmata archaeon]
MDDEEFLNDDWLYKKNITINSSQVDSDLTNFPVLISITDSDLSSKANIEGNDIYFTKSDGSTRLNHEVESYDSSSGELVAWVNVTSLSSTSDTYIYMHYGKPNCYPVSNPEDVWDSSYVGVWHLSEPSGTHYDSTDNDFTGTTYGHVSPYLDAKIGRGCEFNGSYNNSVNIVDDPLLEPSSITVECWWQTDVLLPNDDDFHCAISKADDGWNDGYIMGLYRHDSSSFNGFMFFSDFDTWAPAQWDINNIAVGSWYWAAGTYESSSDVTKLFINGSEADSASGGGTIVGTTFDLRFGTHDWDEWNGKIDEVRISSIVRSDAWLSTTFNTQHNTDTFISVGSEEPVGVSPEYEWVELYNPGDEVVDVSGWYLTDNDGNSFSISGAGNIPPGGYLVCHLAQTGTNSTSDVYGPIISQDAIISLSIQPGPVNTKDTMVDISIPMENMGYNGWMEIMDWDSATGVHNGLFQFDLSVFSSNDIADASFWMYRYDGDSIYGANISVCRITQDWVESTADWNTYDGTNPWAMGGGDFNPDIYDYVYIPPDANGWYKWDITELVQYWQDGTYPNYGMILVGNDEADWEMFRTSDHQLTSIRPILTVNYTVSSPQQIFMLDDTDDLALYDGRGRMVDYLAWGGDVGVDDDNAASWHQWTDGDYVDASQLLESQTLGRDANSNDTNLPSDWENTTGYADPFGIDRSNTFGHSLGNRNIDPPLGNPVIWDIVADPNIQISGEHVNVSCKVMDLDGIYGVWLNLTLPGGGNQYILMTKGIGDNWYHNATYFTLGTYQFTIRANDTIGNWTESGIFQFEIFNNGPILSLGQVYPSQGNMDTWFNFTVVYTDIDNHEPFNILVNISSVGDFVLQPFDLLDLDYSDGKLYYYNNTGFAIGSYTFCFAANDSIGEWTESSYLQFTVQNRNPSLLAGQVEPITGDVDTWFNFTVTYFDLDNHYPNSIMVNISGIGDYNLLEIDSMDNNFADGKEYFYNVSGFPIGSYTFNFAANDSLGDWDETGTLQFDVANRVPGLSSGQVTPATGYAGCWYNFTVIYTDFDNHVPGSISVNITGHGNISLEQSDPLDNDYTDGKEYYYNTTLYPGNFSYYFTACDSLGLWAQVTATIDGPDVLPRPGVIDIADNLVEYDEDISLTGTIDDYEGKPVMGESVAFYIDLNNNGLYEAGELVGEDITLADGRVTIVYTINIDEGTYDYKAVYTGSDNYSMDYAEALLIIDPKQATLTALNNIADMEETALIIATLTDDDDNPIPNQQIEFYIDENRDGFFTGSEQIVLTTTSAEGLASILYYVNLTPENYGIWARYMGSDNYVVTEIEGLLTVQSTGNIPPTIIGVVPNQIKLEDSLPWTLDLTEFEDDIEDTGAGLNWYLTGIDTNLYSVTGMNSSDDVITFIPKDEAFGSDEVTLWLWDSSGDQVSQTIWVNITSVNDPPYFNPMPPNLFVHYDNPNLEGDDPSPWDYTFYVHDVETSKDSLILTTSEPTSDSGNGYAVVDGLKVTFHYPQSMVGKTIYVTLTLSDGTDFTQTVITVNVTSDWVPELVNELPDVVLEENSTLYSVFDLDDFFTDKDHDSLYFSSGYFHLKVDINENNTVDITALGQWTGSELVTFRAQDPVGAIVEDTITVTVIPINDGPTISGVPDLIVHYDYSYAFDLSPYIDDPDNLTSELKVWTSEFLNFITIQQNNNLGIVVTYPESMNGMVLPVTIFVSDGLEEATQEIYITVSSDFPPELKSYLPDVFFAEDNELINAFILSDYFHDIDSSVLFYTNGTTFINVTINDDFSVDFSAPKNWFGTEVVTFRATDPIGALAEDKILIVVVPVNDAPTISSIPRQEQKEGNQWILDITQFIDDIDNNISELIITVQSEMGYNHVTLVGNVLIFQYPKGIYEDIITITVSDGELEASRSFIVSIEGSKPAPPSIWDMIPWPWMFSILLIALCGTFIIHKKRSKYWVYEAFLIHKKGLPIAHATLDEKSELEDVVVSGMFTAIQDFINDTFSGKTSDDWKLNEMKFVDNKILIERSNMLYLAVIFEGNGKRLRNRMRILLGDINAEFGSVLEDWNGGMAQLKGIPILMGSLISGKEEKHTRWGTLKGDIDHGLMDQPSAVNLEGDKSKMFLDNFGEITPVDVGAEMEVYECPVCGNEIYPGDPRCSRCEVEFGESGKVPWRLRIRVMVCPSCGDEVREDAISCPKCGVEFLDLKGPKSFECPICGENVKGQSTCCPGCGVRFDANLNT